VVAGAIVAPVVVAASPQGAQKQPSSLRPVMGSLQQSIAIDGPEKVTVLLPSSPDEGHNLLYSCDVLQSPDSDSGRPSLAVKCSGYVAFVFGFTPDLRVEAGSALTFLNTSTNQGVSP
jgi:hypothetical protein